MRYGAFKYYSMEKEVQELKEQQKMETIIIMTGLRLTAAIEQHIQGAETVMTTGISMRSEPSPLYDLLHKDVEQVTPQDLEELESYKLQQSWHVFWRPYSVGHRTSMPMVYVAMDGWLSIGVLNVGSVWCFEGGLVTVRLGDNVMCYIVNNMFEMLPVDVIALKNRSRS